ncbi:hypothetical protein BT96DRAFT_433807 [Gymnopus androsaceus JB14]|uniref:Uncharacterized protein n=1 Tax=Gymnopus androsaceus JB14 TaxID=1447944 RepID=A0A6A4I588_9AGAR|nr:hypothetical protein BT96DRAFT_433807 [Gymnopus androsaceus JB14]
MSCASSSSSLQHHGYGDEYPHAKATSLPAQPAYLTYSPVDSTLSPPLPSQAMTTTNPTDRSAKPTIPTHPSHTKLRLASRYMRCLLSSTGPIPSLLAPVSVTTPNPNSNQNTHPSCKRSYGRKSMPGLRMRVRSWAHLYCLLQTARKRRILMPVRKRIRIQRVKVRMILNPHPPSMDRDCLSISPSPSPLTSSSEYRFVGVLSTTTVPTATRISTGLDDRCTLSSPLMAAPVSSPTPDSPTADIPLPHALLVPPAVDSPSSTSRLVSDSPSHSLTITASPPTAHLFDLADTLRPGLQPQMPHKFLVPSLLSEWYPPRSEFWPQSMEMKR